MTSTSVIRPLPHKDIRLELHLFISSVSSLGSGNPVDVIHKGLVLLKTVPAARNAVLEFFSGIFDKSAFTYMLELEDRRKQPVDNTAVDELHRELCSFIKTEPSAWSLLLSKWLFEQLGLITSKYSSRGRAPVNGSLNDSLHQWLSCRATRILLNLSVQSIGRLEGESEVGDCIGYLLDYCVQNSPHFDWAVAYVGSVFSDVVISRVLQCGLQDFVLTKGNISVPKFKSVVGILIHLAGSHKKEIENAFLQLFKWSIESGDHFEMVEERNATIPFLLQLSTTSNPLLSCFSQIVPYICKSDRITDLIRFGPGWIQFTVTRQSLLDLVVHLILSVSDEAKKILFYLLEAVTHNNKIVSSVAEEILDLLLIELGTLVCGSTSKVPFLVSLQRDLDCLFPLLLSSETLLLSAAVTILSLIGQQHTVYLPKCVSFVLLHSANDEHLSSVVKLSQGNLNFLTHAISLALNNCDVSDKFRLWTNLTKLLKWEASGTLISLPILEAVYANLDIISRVLSEEDDIRVAHIIAELLRKAVLETKMPSSVQSSRLIIQANISYFYACLIYAEGIDEMKGMRAINSMMRKMCQSCTSTRAYAVREILESSLFRAPSILFGALPPIGHSLVQPPCSLMEATLKQGHTALMGQRHSSVFHGGIIGSGKRKATAVCPTADENIVHNANLLLKLVKACCSGETNQETLDAIIAIALQLVELISPDVMYNGLPWPEEDFCKVTVERDLSIRRILDNYPVVWSLLSFIAHHRPALCYCSVILRAIVATLLGQWFSASQQGREPGHSQPLIDTTTRILQIMALGQLLPFPLTALSDIIPLIPPNQVVQILRDCVWNYMRDNVPSPALFTRDADGNMWRDTATSRPPKQYTETLRLIMLKNIETLGPLYNVLFVNEKFND